MSSAVAADARLHLHDGDGGMFGAEIPSNSPTMVLTQDWTVLPNHVYVLEIHSTNGAFF